MSCKVSSDPWGRRQYKRPIQTTETSLTVFFFFLFSLDVLLLCIYYNNLWDLTPIATIYLFLLGGKRLPMSQSAAAAASNAPVKSFLRYLTGRYTYKWTLRWLSKKMNTFRVFFIRTISGEEVVVHRKHLVIKKDLSQYLIILPSGYVKVWYYGISIIPLNK